MRELGAIRHLLQAARKNPAAFARCCFSRIRALTATRQLLLALVTWLVRTLQNRRRRTKTTGAAFYEIDRALLRI
jgi:hypothetical protein